MNDNLEESMQKIDHHKLVRYVRDGEVPITIEVHRERLRRINMALYLLIIALIIGLVSYSLDTKLIWFGMNSELIILMQSILSGAASFLGFTVIIILYKARKSQIREEIREKRLSQKNL